MSLIAMGFLLAVGWFLFTAFCQLGVFAVGVAITAQDMERDRLKRLKEKATKTGLNPK